MTDAIQIHSRASADGSLTVSMPSGAFDAGAEVLVTLQQICRPGGTREGWHEFVERTYGSCAGLDLQRPPQGTLEVREAVD